MAKDNQEIESKFFVVNLVKIEELINLAGAECIVPRSFEYNLRLDDANKNLQREHKVLRIRKYDDIRLTFKGPGERKGNALVRTEIELIVNDFDQARLFLENLGFTVSAIYEKYRTMYRIGDALITLDELPFGNFVEIEAESNEKISELAIQINLNPNAAIPLSYQGLFEYVKSAKNLPVNNLSFDDFKSIHLTPLDLGVVPADF